MSGTTPQSQPAGHRGRAGGTRRRSLAVLLLAAFVSFMFSPVTAVLTLVVAPLVALIAWPFFLLGSAGAKQVVYAAAGAVLGALPYFVVGVVVGIRAGS
jgi:hypothetical protein